MAKPPKSPQQLKDDNIKEKRSFMVNSRRMKVLDDIAAAEDQPVSWLVDEAIRYYLEDIKKELPVKKSK